MNLSGWARLWIVASLVWWIGGFFWLQSVNYSYTQGGTPDERFPFHMPPLQPDFSMCPTVAEWNAKIAAEPPGTGGRWRSDEPANCRNDMTIGWNTNWSVWLQRSSEAGHLPVVAFGPLIILVLGFANRWIAAGFRGAPGKKSSEPKPPDSA